MIEYHVLNLGAGVQSTALYLLARDGKLCFDVAIFADTQEEPVDVYKHLAYLQSLNDPPIWIRTAGKLGDNILHGKGATNRFVSIPCFTKSNTEVRLHCGNREQPKPKIGILRRQCTKEYKIEVVDRAIRRELLALKPKQWVPKDVKIHQYFGITTDERQRAERAVKRFAKVKWTVPHYPLLDMGWSRQDCIAYLADKLPHPVPRSACVFCPYKTNAEWQRLKDTDPDGWRRAVEIDQSLRVEGTRAKKYLRDDMYLHRSCVPLDVIDFQATATTFRPMRNECQGMCGV